MSCTYKRLSPSLSLSLRLSHTHTQSLLLTLPLSLNVEQNLPVVAPGILSWTDDDIAELYQSTTRDIASQINAVKGDWRDIIRSAILIQLYVTLPYLDSPCLALLHLTLPYFTLPCLASPNLTLPYFTLPCLT